MNQTYTIRVERTQDFLTVENLTREAFWNVYQPGCTEHFVLHKFRSNPDFIPELSLVMEKDSVIIGHVMYCWSHIDLDDGTNLKMMTFGPISIHPDYKRQGYGKILLDYSMDKAAYMGAGCLLICGNIDFYGKSGFITAASKGIRYADCPDNDAPFFLCKELKKGFLEGVKGCYRDPEEYFAAVKNPDEFELYDRTFPQKLKLKLPGQLM